jgi:ABC-2 type transport system permease protein
MRRRLRYIIRKEILQLRRDPRLRGLLVFAPLFQLFVFGYAVTLDIRYIPMVVCDRARTTESRELTGRFARSEHFDLRAAVDSPSEMDQQLAAGRALIGVHIPADFSRRRARGETAEVQIVLDGTDMNSAGVAGGYARALIAHHLRQRDDRSRQVPALEHEARIWYNPDLKSVNFMVPGVICLILGTVMTSVTAMALVRERETGTLEQLIVTPVRPLELLLGKTLPFAAIGMLDVGLVILLARYWFGVEVAGSLLLLLGSALIFLLTTLGLGLFISTASRSQQQAMLTAFFVLIPSVVLSGFIFPIENMPRGLQFVTYAIPLRYFVEIVRGVFLQGVGIQVLWPQMTVLAALGGAIFALSATRFQKHLG